MSQFSNVTYTGTVQGSGTAYDPVDGTFILSGSGGITAVLSEAADGQISGTWSASVSYTATGAAGTETGSGGDSGTVYGTAASLTFVATGGVFVHGIGALTNNERSLTASFGWNVLGAANGTAAATLAGDPGAVTPVHTGPAEIVVIPDSADWTATTSGDGTTFVSPQFNFDQATGAWSLVSPPAPDTVPAGQMPLIQGSDKEAYFSALSQSLAWGAIVSRDAGGPAVMQEVFGAASTATTIFNIETSFIGRVLHALDRAPAAAAYGTWSTEVEAELSSANSQLASDVHQAAAEAVQDIYAQGTIAEYLLNFWRSAKLVKHESAQFFSLETGSGTVIGESHADTMIGSALADRFSGGANNDIGYGSGGNDTLEGGTGDDVLDGGAGLDTAIFNSARASYSLSNSAGRITVSGAEGVDTLSTVERVRFSDRTVAFDLAAGDAARNAAEVIGAAFGTAYLQPAYYAYVGIGVGLFDAGMSLPQVCQLVIDTPLFQSLTGSRSNTAFVNTVYRNIAGSLPSDTERNLYVGMLQGSGGTLTQAELLMVAAGTAANDSNIGLTGLQQNGLDFI